MKNLVRFGAALPVIGAAVLGLSNPAQASLEGTFTIGPFLDGAPDGGVILEGTGVSVPNSDGLSVPLTSLDFVPPSGPGEPSGSGEGSVIRLSGTGDFSDFDGWTGTILDLAFPVGFCTGPAPCIYDTTNSADITGVVPDWLVIDTPGVPAPISPGGFSAELDSLFPPEYENTVTGTTVSIPTTITIFKVDESGNITSDPPSTGIGTISADFVGLSIAETIALFDESGEIELDDDGLPVVRGWSGQFVVSKDVPEPASVLGLMMLGLGGIASKTLKSKKNG